MPNAPASLTTQPLDDLPAYVRDRIIADRNAPRPVNGNVMDGGALRRAAPPDVAFLQAHRVSAHIEADSAHVGAPQAAPVEAEDVPHAPASNALPAFADGVSLQARVRALVVHRGLTPLQVSLASDLSRQTIYNLMAGSTKTADAAVLGALAIAFDCPVELLGPPRSPDVGARGHAPPTAPARPAEAPRLAPVPDPGPADGETLGERLKRLRLARGWSQGQTAAQLGLDASHYKKVERGEQDGFGRHEVAVRIAGVLGGAWADYAAPRLLTLLDEARPAWRGPVCHPEVDDAPALSTTLMPEPMTPSAIVPDVVSGRVGVTTEVSAEATTEPPAAPSVPVETSAVDPAPVPAAPSLEDELRTLRAEAEARPTSRFLLTRTHVDAIAALLPPRVLIDLGQRYPHAITLAPGFARAHEGLDLLYAALGDSQEVWAA